MSASYTYKTLTVDIHSYWHAGSGRTSGSHVDRLVEKDHNGLPFLGGKHKKGLLRDAVRCAEHWGWFERTDSEAAKPLDDLLFGRSSQRRLGEKTGHDDAKTVDESRFFTEPGVILVSDARLPKNEYQYLSGDANEAPAMRAALYRSLFSTAIDHRTGTAKSHSLRGIEVTVPLTLEAELTCIHPEANTFFAYLEQCLPLIDHVGGMRNRGLGRATLKLIDHKEP